MNREIKFRGKRLANDEWCYGSLLIWADGECTILEKSDSSNAVWKREINPDTVGQFTGLYDANGKEICEGDILREVVSGKLVEVAYKAPEFCFKDNVYGYCFLNHPEYFEVAGNIHDNPSLLGGGLKCFTL